MKLLLTSSGIANDRIRAALTALLGKPVAESNALFLPTAIYPFQARASTTNPMLSLGWSSCNIFELSVLSSVERAVWMKTLEEADALLVWGGDPVFLGEWMRRSGVAEELPKLRAVYVGVSAGSIVTSETFVETYQDPPRFGETLGEETVRFPDGVSRTLVTARGLGFVPFGMIPHFENPRHEDASLENAAVWASKAPLPTYAIDDQTALVVNDSGDVEVVSEGRWKLFPSR
jgi:dipeptidase E